MINIGSKLRIKDNTGVNIIRIIGTFGKKKKFLTIGDIIKGVVVQSTESDLKRSDKLKAVIVNTKTYYRRKNGNRFKFSENCAIILKDDLTPKGNKILCIVPSEIKNKFKKIGTLAPLII